MEEAEEETLQQMMLLMLNNQAGEEGELNPDKDSQKQAHLSMEKFMAGK